MKKLFRNSLLMLVAGAFAVSCADYNVTDDFKAEKDPTFVEPYKDLNPIKSYIDREKYPNMTLGTTLNVTEFNKQELAHAAAVANFDNVSFGSTLMSGKIVNAKGVMNFLDMSDLLAHVDDIGYEVFGSPIVANEGQADEWLNTLTAPIEIVVDYVEGKTVDFNEMPEGPYNGTVEKGEASIVKYDNQNCLQIGTAKSPQANVHIIDGFEVDSLAKYTITFWAKCAKGTALFSLVFSGNNQIDGGSSGGRFSLEAGNWKKFVVECQSAPGETAGYLRIDNTKAASFYIQKVEVGYYPDNHRPQTAQEKTDTINYALNAWCDGLMKINAGRINTFDLIDDAIGTQEMENGMLDLKHSTDKFFWQDVIGSEQYAPVVSKVASEAYQKYEGDPAALKFFISESGLDDQKKFESLKYWIGIWDANGAKIDGINAKLNLSYSEDAATHEADKVTLDNLLTNLASTGKLIRLSNFDITYKNAEGAKVAAKDITDDQRQKLADYYGYVIKSYMTKIPHDKQAGICKGNLADTSDPVGLWAVDSKSKDWVRTATYKAFCDALGGN
ncbi:MAG: endo-1,4-beta-xylanase [Bacteroidaceae bacterium]|nr:endo-1,4-beta-xylanase [Prevotella sp.]MBO7602748.1 endo-1,4-beta-xylanase [Bacteroidaceae bacterium]